MLQYDARDEYQNVYLYASLIAILCKRRQHDRRLKIS